MKLQALEKIRRRLYSNLLASLLLVDVFAASAHFRNESAVHYHATPACVKASHHPDAFIRSLIQFQSLRYAILQAGEQDFQRFLETTIEGILSECKLVGHKLELALDLN